MRREPTHTAEAVEGRELAKGKTGEQIRVRTQCRSALQRALDWIRAAARRNRARPLTALWHHVYDIDRLREAYDGLNRDAAPGIDGQTWAAYGEALEANLRDLSDGLNAAHTASSPSSGDISRSWMADRDPSVSRPWKTRSSSGRRWRDLIPSMRRTSGASPTASDQGAVLTTRWTR